MEEPQPAYKVKKLTSDEVRGLRRAGLTEDQIEAVSLVGMGADEVNELMLRGLEPRAKTRENCRSSYAARDSLACRVAEITSIK
jgi:hypothetical protein